MLGIANFCIITVSKDVPFPRSPRLQTFDHSACDCESMVGPCCVLQIHTQVHWFCASCFWLSRSTLLELKWTQIEFNYTYCQCQYVQDDSVEKVSVLLGDSIRSLWEKCSYEHVSNFEWLPKEDCVDLQIQIIVKVEKLLTVVKFNFNVIFKWRICYVEVTNTSQFTINVRKFHRQPQFTLQLVREDRVLFVSADRHVCLYLQRFVYPPLFCKLRFSSSRTNRNPT